jgi:hypothetical protein
MTRMVDAIRSTRPSDAIATAADPLLRRSRAPPGGPSRRTRAPPGRVGRKRRVEREAAASIAF